MEEALGKKIKQLRTGQGLTLRELAQRAKLSTGYISLVERGLTSISLTSLQSIAAALGVASSEFFSTAAAPAGPERLVRSYDMRAFRQKDSHYVYHSLGCSNTEEDWEMEPVLITLLPGQTWGSVLPYSHEGEEFGYVLEGTPTLLMENSSYDLSPGDSLHIPSTLPHNLANYTSKLAKLLYVNTSKIAAFEKEGAYEKNQTDV